MGDEVGIEWSDEDADRFAFADRSVVERAYLGWLGPTLVQAREALRRGARSQLGLPDGTRFTFDGAIATPLGPRSRSGFRPPSPIRTSPSRSRRGGPMPRTRDTCCNRALALMWTDVRWRRPAIDGEAAVLEDVHRHPHQAYPMEPDLPYPWHAWAEVIAFARHRGCDGAPGHRADRRRRSHPAPGSATGASRVRITHEGWSLWVPG